METKENPLVCAYRDKECKRMFAHVNLKTLANIHGFNQQEVVKNLYESNFSKIKARRRAFYVKLSSHSQFIKE